VTGNWYLDMNGEEVCDRPVTDRLDGVRYQDYNGNGMGDTGTDK